MKSILNLTAIVILLLFSFACNSDEEIIEPCFETEYIGEFKLDDVSRSFPPYQDDNEVLIFSDSMGNEFQGTLEIEDFSVFEECRGLERCHEEPGNFRCVYSYEGERRKISLEFKEIDIIFDFCNSLYPDLNEVGANTTSFEVFDLLRIIVNPPTIATNSVNQDIIYTNFDSSSPYSQEDIIRDSFQLHGREFGEIYALGIGSSLCQLAPSPVQFNFFYSVDLGLIGFESTDKSISLKYERTE